MLTLYWIPRKLIAAILRLMHLISVQGLELQAT